LFRSIGQLRGCWLVRTVDRAWVMHPLAFGSGETRPANLGIGQGQFPTEGGFALAVNGAQPSLGTGFGGSCFGHGSSKTAARRETMDEGVKGPPPLPLRKHPFCNI